jgi:DNA uptake protein ComE-like DNA-binding protein
LPLVRTDPAPPRLQAIRIDPSQGTEAELGTLEGAGPALIRRILWYRKEVGPVTGIDELRRIPGIGMLRLHRWSPIIEARVPVGGTGSGG